MAKYYSSLALGGIFALITLVLFVARLIYAAKCGSNEKSPVDKFGESIGSPIVLARRRGVRLLVSAISLLCVHWTTIALQSFMCVDPLAVNTTGASLPKVMAADLTIQCGTGRVELEERRTSMDEIGEQALSGVSAVTLKSESAISHDDTDTATTTNSSQKGLLSADSEPPSRTVTPDPMNEPSVPSTTTILRGIASLSDLQPIAIQDMGKSLDIQSEQHVDLVEQVSRTITPTPSEGEMPTRESPRRKRRSLSAIDDADDDD